MPFSPVLKREGFFIHRPREYNVLADAVCNLILNENCPLYEWCDPLFDCSAVGWVSVKSDGACRRDSSNVAVCSSCAVVIEFHSLQDNTSTIVGVKGVQLDACDSFMAELEGAILACEFAVQLFRGTVLWTG